MGNKEVGEATFSSSAYCFQNSDNQVIFDNVQEQFLQNSKAKFFQKYGIDKLLDKSLADLSKGQRKFITLLSTISKKKDLYVFDEPMDLLDEAKQIIILEELKKLSSDSIIVISSHNTSVAKIATRILTLREGNLYDTTSKSIKQVFNKYRRISRKFSNKEIFHCEDISFLYQDAFIAMKFPSLKIRNNDIIGLIGINGVGKTTYLKLISGVIEPTFGRIQNRAFERFGFLTQDPDKQLFGNTVYEELFIGIDKISVEHIKKAQYYLKCTKLSACKKQHPIFLSGGQKQILVFISLLMHEPEILFLDEFTRNLDINSVNIILSLIEEYRKNRDLAVVFTDQVDEYLTLLCDKVIKI